MHTCAAEAVSYVVTDLAAGILRERNPSPARQPALRAGYHLPDFLPSREPSRMLFTASVTEKSAVVLSRSPVSISTSSSIGWSAAPLSSLWKRTEFVDSIEARGSVRRLRVPLVEVQQ